MKFQQLHPDADALKFMLVRCFELKVCILTDALISAKPVKYHTRSTAEHPQLMSENFVPIVVVRCESLSGTILQAISTGLLINSQARAVARHRIAIL